MEPQHTEYSLPVRPFLSIVTSQWWAVNPNGGFEAEPFENETEAASFCRGFNEAHRRHYTRTAAEPSDQLILLACSRPVTVQSHRACPDDTGGGLTSSSSERGRENPRLHDGFSPVERPCPLWKTEKAGVVPSPLAPLAPKPRLAEPRPAKPSQARPRFTTMGH